MVHQIVVGLGFGDEGKGRVVDYLCKQSPKKAVIRFSGGPQAAHNVITPDGRHHTFAQFGSGIFHGVPTYLSHYMLVNPFNLMREYEALKEKVDHDPLERLWISADAAVVTPYHRLANRLRETQRGEGRHGSCGQGIGETQMLKNEQIVLQIDDLMFSDVCSRVLRQIEKRYVTEFGDDFKPDWDLEDVVDQYFEIAQKLQIDYDGSKLSELLDSGDCVFEGSQGVLLDEWYGFHPYTTWSTTTPANALKLLRSRGHDGRVIGVTRSYMTRHGAGPFPTEVEETMDESHPELHNGTGEYQGAWRRGHLDLMLLRYAAQACEQLDEVAVTHLDTFTEYAVTGYNGVNVLPTKDFYSKPLDDLDYQALVTDFLLQAHSPFDVEIPHDTEDLLYMIADAVAAPITIAAYGPTSVNTLELHLS